MAVTRLWAPRTAMSGAAVGTGSDDDGRVHRVHGGRASSWRNRYKESRPPIFKTGGLGPWMQPHHYEMWVYL